MGRAIDLSEAILILKENQAQGLVLQPSNTQDIDFICSCCGCCCGLLGIHKKLPMPLDFWVTNFYARIDTDLCTGCKKCINCKLPQRLGSTYNKTAPGIHTGCGCSTQPGAAGYMTII